MEKKYLPPTVGDLICKIFNNLDNNTTTLGLTTTTAVTATTTNLFQFFVL